MEIHAAQSQTQTKVQNDAVVILVPLWTMAVANVYRKSKRITVSAEETREEP